MGNTDAWGNFQFFYANFLLFMVLTFNSPILLVPSVSEHTHGFPIKSKNTFAVYFLVTLVLNFFPYSQITGNLIISFMNWNMYYLYFFTIKFLFIFFLVILYRSNVLGVHNMQLPGFKPMNLFIPLIHLISQKQVLLLDHNTHCRESAFPYLSSTFPVPHSWIRTVNFVLKQRKLISSKTKVSILPAKSVPLSHFSPIAKSPLFFS